MDDNPFHRYRLELLHKREVHRQQRRAAKLARLQAKESQRNQRLLEGRLSLSDRFKEWKRRRQLKKEREVEWLREKTDYHPFFLWLREGETKFFLLGAIVLIGAFGYLLYLKQLHIRLLYKRLAGSQTVLVRVGDEEIRTGAFEKRLWTRHAEREIQLETLLLLLQQATEKIDLDANQYRTLEDEIRLEHSMTLAEEVDFTEEKYTLSHVSQADKQKLFDERRDELPVYHLSSVHFKDSASAEEFVRAFLKGMTPERAAETYSMDERPVRLKPIMAGELDERLGVLQARELSLIHI